MVQPQPVRLKPPTIINRIARLPDLGLTSRSQNALPHKAPATNRSQHHQRIDSLELARGQGCKRGTNTHATQRDLRHASHHAQPTYTGDDAVNPGAQHLRLTVTTGGITRAIIADA